MAAKQPLLPPLLPVVQPGRGSAGHSRSGSQGGRSQADLAKLAGAGANGVNGSGPSNGGASSSASIDVLVSNAAVNPTAGPLVDTPLDALDKIMDINVKAALALVQEAAPHMRRGGRVVLISSVTAYKCVFFVFFVCAACALVCAHVCTNHSTDTQKNKKARRRRSPRTP